MTEEIRQAFDEARSRVERMQRQGVDPQEITRAHTDDVDSIVVNTFEEALTEAGLDHEGMAMLALGGYGRRELAPGSDLDLLLLHRGRTASDVAVVNRRLTYPLWDSGRDLGNRVRDPREVIRSFDRIDEVCAVLDARLLHGDKSLFDDLVSSIDRRLERGRASFLAALRQATSGRHERFGHAGHLLEPNLRDSAGGLRDIHTVRWAASALPGAGGLDGLVESGYLSALDRSLLAAGHSFLTRVRIELHLYSGRHQDQLHLAEQDALAARLGYSTEGRTSSEDLMQGLFGHARQVDAVVQAFWHRWPGQRRRRRMLPAGLARRGPASRSVGDGCVIQGGRLEVVAVTKLSEDAAGWLRAFERSARSGVPVGRSSLNRLHEELLESPEPPWSLPARDAFFEILATAGVGVGPLDQMDVSGLLVALIPEWASVQAYPQRDLYHRYTVDRHLFAAACELAKGREATDPDLRDAWSRVRDPRPLLLATFLHDIGKGQEDDHSVVGEQMTRRIATRMLLPSEQAEEVAFLVRHHLLLAETAVRRDLGDPRTIQEVAGAVADVERLAKLYLLTRADSVATGPQAWSSFRASLIKELYGAVRDLLEGRDPEESRGRGLHDRVADIETLLGLADGAPADLEVRTVVRNESEADELLLATADRPGVFSVVTGVLALRGVDVHDAEVYTREDGTAVEALRVTGRQDDISPERWDRIRTDIVEALAGRLDIDGELARKAAQTRRRRWRDGHGTAVEVVVDNAASAEDTVIEVHAQDRLGLLRGITKALAGQGCDLRLAKVSTYGTRAVDAFYLRDLEGLKITDEQRLGEISAAVRKAVGDLDPGR